MAESESNNVRLFMWVPPRTVSTALTKCLSAIDGMEVWFECFTYCSFARHHYQEAHIGDDLPMVYEGNEEKAKEAATLLGNFVGCNINADRIMFDDMRGKIEKSTSKYLLAKDGCIAFPDEKSRQYIPRGFKHVFLIRDPYLVLSSYKKAVINHMISMGLRTEESLKVKPFDMEKEDPWTNWNEMYSSLLEMWKHVRANIDPNPIVLNTNDLLTNPATVLSKLCKETGLPYSESLLSWDASPDIIKKWKAASDDLKVETNPFYRTAALSGNFFPPKPPVPNERLASDVRRVAEAAMPYFEEMNKFKL